MNKAFASFWFGIVSVLFFGGLTIAAIVTKEITIFYVIYVFWWDELIKAIFETIKLSFQGNQIEDVAAFKIQLYVRFFMLFIYVVFILICFGFLIDWNIKDNVSKNIDVFIFRNIYFNLSLLTFIGREVYVYANTFHSKVNVANVFTKGGLTLHLSIIFGMLLWGLSTNKIGSFMPESFSSYSYIVSIIPFFIIKFIFDWWDLSEKRKMNWNTENNTELHK
ncbi:hypothetical protein [uncultured Cytophaga sp.]|uniref:hypothetical protein n=1 Tax=uncultured Cytophaga sp. TaxID=160238 RepID=UPI00262EDE76|nr:hypothetical protein [uncultured Cytophaga sp.]